MKVGDLVRSTGSEGGAYILGIIVMIGYANAFNKNLYYVKIPGSKINFPLRGEQLELVSG